MDIDPMILIYVLGFICVVVLVLSVFFKPESRVEIENRHKFLRACLDLFKQEAELHTPGSAAHKELLKEIEYIERKLR